VTRGIPFTLPYVTNDDLPVSVQRHLPEHAQDIFREAFNHAWRQYAGDPRQEEIAHRVAWSAVKRVYVKVGTEWVSRSPIWPT
jgi:cation transport regulator